MKQLEGEKKCIHYCIQRAKQCNTKKLIFVGSHFLQSNWVHVGIVADVSSTDSAVDSGCDHKVTVNCQWNYHRNNR